MQKTDCHEFELFVQKKVMFKSLNAQITSLELRRTPSSVFSATKQNYENAEATIAQKHFLSEKKLLNAILRAKLK